MVLFMFVTTVIVVLGNISCCISHMCCMISHNNYHSDCNCACAPELPIGARPW